MRYGCPLRSCKYNNGSDKDTTKSKPKANAQRHIACAHGVTFQKLDGKRWQATAPLKCPKPLMVVSPTEAKGADHKQEMGDAAQHQGVLKPQHTGFLRQRELFRTSTSSGLEVHIFPFNASSGSCTSEVAAEELKSSKYNSGPLISPSSVTMPSSSSSSSSSSSTPSPLGSSGISCLIRDVVECLTRADSTELSSVVIQFRKRKAAEPNQADAAGGAAAEAAPSSPPAKRRRLEA